ncbi:MAG: hypothetical protein M3Y27_14385 [Acidobacteriota bacterium]|nr:hypothetical protein [Acidobacteriota bacterium]
MKATSISVNALLIALLSVSVAGVATAQTAKKAPVTVTGCLAQGDEANEFSIKDESGKTYGLLGSRVNMKPHLGHKVTVTGTPTKEKKEKQESKTGKPEESEHLRVTNLAMVSTTCP